MLDLTAPQPTIVKGICPELDALRARYEALDHEMHKSLVSEVERLDGKLPEFMKRVRMTMIPSIGYFLVVPKVGPKWIKFRDSLPKQGSVDEQTLLGSIFPELISPFGWKFHFLNDTELFFQSELTE